MGTIAAVQSRTAAADARTGAFVRVQDSFVRVNAEFSRFDPQSTLRRLGRVSAFGQPCWEAAMWLREASEAAFDPFWRGVGVPDFGAIAKGFAVDVAAKATEDADDLLIDLGGNVKAVRGDWTTGVKSPCGDGFAAVVTLRAGEALATSAEYFRGKHICDGRTGQPVSNGVASVTVLCTSAMWADGLSTTLFVLGPEAGRRFLRERFAASSVGTDPAFVGTDPVGTGPADMGTDPAVLWLMDDGCAVAVDPAARFRLTAQPRFPGCQRHPH